MDVSWLLTRLVPFSSPDHRRQETGVRRNSTHIEKTRTHLVLHASLKVTKKLQYGGFNSSD